MAQYTQRAIIETFEKMLTEMPFDKITVSALVRRCEISSNTETFTTFWTCGCAAS